MKTNFTITLDEALRNKVEAAYYEAETAARNVAMSLVRNDDSNRFNQSYAYQWDRLIKYAKVYSDAKDEVSNTIVMPTLKERGITANVNWSLDFESKVVTVTYDDEETNAEPKNTITIDCPEEYVNPVAWASNELNAYDTVMGYISRNSGASLDNSTINEITEKQAVAYREFITNRSAVEDNVVKPYLSENNISVNVNWELTYSTGKITITY
jgi:hypothetical protein